LDTNELMNDENATSLRATHSKKKVENLLESTNTTTTTLTVISEPATNLNQQVTKPNKRLTNLQQFLDHVHTVTSITIDVQEINDKEDGTSFLKLVLFGAQLDSSRNSFVYEYSCVDNGTEIGHIHLKNH
jgi:hypothetical protein